MSRPGLTGQRASGRNSRASSGARPKRDAVIDVVEAELNIGGLVAVRRGDARHLAIDARRPRRRQKVVLRGDELLSIVLHVERSPFAFGAILRRRDGFALQFDDDRPKRRTRLDLRRPDDRPCHHHDSARDGET